MKTTSHQAALHSGRHVRDRSPDRSREGNGTTEGHPPGAAFRCPSCGGSVPEAARTVEAYERFIRRLFSRQEEFEQSLASAIHDDLAQQLSGALLYLEGCWQLQNLLKNDARESFQIGLSLLQDSIREARRIAAELQPLMCAEHGIALGIECLIHEARNRPGPEIEFRVQGDIGRLDPELENAVFRIVRELLSNACRHSGSEAVCVRLARTADHLRVEVEDWGAGFDASEAGGRGFGLQEVRQRSRSLGGETIVNSRPEKGTRVVVRFPLR